MANRKIVVTADVMRALHPIARSRGFMDVESLLEFVGIEAMDHELPANDQEQFVLILKAAMLDAVTTGHCTMLTTTIVPPGKTEAKMCRFVVMPEEWHYDFRPKKDN